MDQFKPGSMLSDDSLGTSAPLLRAPGPVVSFDDTVSQLYRAATGGLSWPDALLSVAQLFNASLAALQRIDLADQRLLSHQSASTKPIEDGVLQYIREYHMLDPRRAQLQDANVVPPGAWYHDHDHLSDRFVDADPFYQHFLAAYGARYLSATLLSPAPGQLVGFGLELSARRGPLNTDERELLRRLGEHLADALRAHERVRQLQAQQWAGHGLLQGFAYPMWLIDVDRFVHFANVPAQCETELARCLTRRGAHLAATASRLDGQLDTRLHALATQAHGASAVLPCHATSAQAPLWLHLSLLRPEQVIAAFGRQPLVLVTLFDPTTVPAIDAFALASLLELTPTQARVAARLAQGETAGDIALHTGTRSTTVRSHINQLLRRVGARRGADLIRVLQDGHSLWSATPRTAP